MLVGLIFTVLVLYSKPREYEDVAIEGSEDFDKEVTMTSTCWGALIACIVTAVVSIITGSLPLAALAGLLTMLITRVIKISELDEMMDGGIAMMGFIGYVMLVAAGYGNVLTETGAVETLVEQAVGLMGDSKALAAFIMLLVGLLVTMGIGTSFGTVPIIAAIYVPLGMKMGFSTKSIILLIGIAAALGDAGSPASDSTLGPTSGLNADGQHDHVWDTCVPTFIAYDVFLIIGGVIGAMILG